jgi:hypothetical protein
MTRERFKDLIRCLHITDPTTYDHIQKGDLGYEKIRQVRWLVDEIKSACMRKWSLEKFVTIDEMMVRYKLTKALIVLFANICLRNWRSRVSNSGYL